jgi:hypothetical protein
LEELITSRPTDLAICLPFINSGCPDRRLVFSLTLLSAHRLHKSIERSQLPHLQDNYPNPTNPQIAPNNQHPPYGGPTPLAHLDPRNGSNYFGSPSPAGYFSTAPLLGVYCGTPHDPPPGPQQQWVFYGRPHPQQQGMMYELPPQPQQQQVLLGFMDEYIHKKQSTGHQARNSIGWRIFSLTMTTGTRSI